MRQLIRQALVAAARAAAFMAAFVMSLVWEGGRWIGRLVRAAAAGPQQEAIAGAELDDEVETLKTEAAKTTPVATSEETKQAMRDYGLAAMAFLTGDDAERAKAILGIDPAAADYLDSLDLAQANKLMARDPASIAAHLVGAQHLPGLPVPMGLVEHMRRKTERLAADTAELRRVREQSERDRADDRALVAAALEDLIAQPQWYPKRGIA